MLEGERKREATFAFLYPVGTLAARDYIRVEDFSFLPIGRRLERYVTSALLRGRRFNDSSSRERLTNYLFSKQ